MTPLKSGVVSVTIVTHDNWPDLELAIESVLNQSYRNLEIVVIDNDSHDSTADEVSNRYSGRVRYIRQENRLDAGGYNRGITETSGEFVQLLDADDFLAPNKIEKQLEVFAANPGTDIVYGDGCQFQTSPGRPDWEGWETAQYDDMLARLLDPLGEGGGLLSHGVLMKRQALERIGPWDEKILSADQDYWLRCAAAGCVFRYSPGAWAFHRRRSGQMSSDRRAMLGRMEQTLTKALTYVKSEPHRSILRRRLAGIRFAIAVMHPDLDRPHAVQLLESARELDPVRVNGMAYRIGRAVIRTPGARRAFHHPSLRHFRRRVGRAIGVLD
ncbi:MAG TPA: glycosyltransferase [Gemmatimonadaceae bacterium]|jgi:glycosyltransferase involved in cell wall biosynthesis